MSGPHRSAPVSPLEALGLRAEDEQLYRQVLRRSGVALVDLAADRSVATDHLEEDLGPLVRAGLVRVVGGTVHADRPDESLGAVLAVQDEQLRTRARRLDELREMLPSLRTEHLAGRLPRAEPVLVEAVEGGDVVDILTGLSASGSGDLLWLRQDQWALPVGRSLDAWVTGLMRAGRRSRAIYPARVLEEAPEVVLRRGEAGEHIRVLASVPSRLAVLGDAALVPEHWGRNTGRRLVVRQRGILDALRALFEQLWDRALPVPGLDGGERGTERVGDRGLLLDQLAGGAKDEQIARALNLSVRTVRRRVAEVMAELDAQSRFHAGVEAVRRGWV